MDTMAVGEETPPNNTSNFSPVGGTTTATEGGRTRNQGHEDATTDEVLTDFIKKHRDQLLTMLEQEEKERRLKEVKTRLQFEDDGGNPNSSPKKTSSALNEDNNFSKPYRPSTARSKSKFVSRIAEFTFPPKLKMSSNVEKYDGLKDPDGHLNV
jgi:hypothetical protein